MNKNLTPRLWRRKWWRQPSSSPKETELEQSYSNAQTYHPMHSLYTKQPVYLSSTSCTSYNLCTKALFLGIDLRMGSCNQSLELFIHCSLGFRFGHNRECLNMAGAKSKG